MTLSLVIQGFYSPFQLLFYSQLLVIVTQSDYKHISYYQNFYHQPLQRASIFLFLSLERIFCCNYVAHYFWPLRTCLLTSVKGKCSNHILYHPYSSLCLFEFVIAKEQSDCDNLIHYYLHLCTYFWPATVYWRLLTIYSAAN